ncbi:MAG: hypothetical protein LBS18_03290 [Clostridiales bacterium]|nr:hypothetical protein [Clostridiales bacterium]
MLFKKQNQEPERPKLVGENFDVFPDLGENDRYSKTDADDTDGGETKEDPPEPTAFQQKIAAIDEAKWRLYQILGGVVLGIACSACLILFDDTIGLLLAFGIAMLLPNMFEKRALRPIRVLRITFCIVLLLGLGFSLLYRLVFSPTEA